MMPLNSAIAIALQRAAWLYAKIESWEAEHRTMAHKFRSEIGSIRCLLVAAGVERHQLPEVPFLDPAHRMAYIEESARRKREREALGEVG